MSVQSVRSLKIFEGVFSKVSISGFFVVCADECLCHVLRFQLYVTRGLSKWHVVPELFEGLSQCLSLRSLEVYF